MPKINWGNLHPPYTPEEAREYGRQGGIKSGEVRRKKRDMKEAAKLLLELDVKDLAAKMEIYETIGVELDDIDNQMLMLVAIWQRAIKGNVRAAEFLRDTVTHEMFDEEDWS